MSTSAAPETNPLSWDEARLRLRRVLEEYLSEPPPSRLRNSQNQPAPTFVGRGARLWRLLAWWVDHDLDLYAGALALSATLLILACFSLNSRELGLGTSGLNAAAALHVYRSQVVASVVLVGGSLLSLWMVRRRRFLCLTDSDKAKRREISKFLRTIDQETKELQALGPGSSASAKTVSDCGLDLSGMSLTDLYPVYRKVRPEDSSAASWYRIPSLLLVEGDYVALQVGDVVPAECHLVDDPLIRLEVGICIAMADLGETATSILARLPSGRKTLAEKDAEHLLTLCNGMRIFVVDKTPIYDFIRRSEGRTRSSQMSRQVTEVRRVLSLLAPAIMFLTALIVFVRPGAAYGDLSLLLPLPLLAGLGCLPVVGPVFVFFLEMIGTARILTTVHPFTSLNNPLNDDVQSLIPKTRLLFRYLSATMLTRLSLWDFAGRVQDFCVRLCLVKKSRKSFTLVRVPPASLNLLEKLGVATAFALVDDELACDPHAVPQQLLIPSAQGLKLLDLCPAYDSDSDESAKDAHTGRRRGKSFDSDSSEEATQPHSTQHFSALRRKVLTRRRLKRRRMKKNNLDDEDEDDDTESTDNSSLEVQFEEPTWWQHLPSLKCIGLAGMLVVEGTEGPPGDRGPPIPVAGTSMKDVKENLVKLISSERRSDQLRVLAQCIGFSDKANSYGERGDLTPFTECVRLHILSKAQFKGRLEIDTHERSSEMSRWWGLLRPDSTSVVVKDSRSNAYQLLTVGDPAVVTSLCNEAWQGEISTILPLGPTSRQTIINTTNNWKLGDLDVAAFSYSPVPHTLESRLVGQDSLPSQVYLLDENFNPGSSLAKDKNASTEWSLLRNQVFLGVLGSLVVPRREIQRLLSVLNDAGVRFVYFSPRNMRRQKELAIQMGIDVAWNCAISLRPLESGEDDPHRMVSNYADWDVNAKLPHGVEDVRNHLQEVDNVPLLVSLFTDVTKETTKDMVEIFQDYHDTVIAIGLSHLPRNDSIFSAADIAVGIDILIETEKKSAKERSFHGYDPSTPASLRPSELEFVSAIASHSCAFRFRGASSVSHISTILRKSRAALQSATASAVFLVDGCLAFSIFVLLSACAPSTTIPYIPALGAVLYLQFFLPAIGLAMAMGDPEVETMHRVPAKNDQSIIFGRREGRRLYMMLLLKAILPALFPQLFYLIAFGELVIHFDGDLVESSCDRADNWAAVLRCEALKSYSGPARTSAGVLSLFQFIFCVAVASASFQYRFTPIWEQMPWQCNEVWVISVFLVVALAAAYAGAYTETGTAAVLPWYYYFLSLITPFLCLAWNEACKHVEVKHERRAEKLRRLQFETRLGAWSPK